MLTQVESPLDSVAAEVAAGDVLTCPQVARRGPSTRQGKSLHPSTVLRWILDGVKLPNGRKVKLEGIRCGGRWVTSLAAYQRFLEAQTPSLDPTPIPASRTTRQQQRAAERAAVELSKIGI